MTDIRVRQEPWTNFGAVEPVKKEMAEFEIGFADDVFEGDSVVNLGVVFKRVDLMVAD